MNTLSRTLSSGLCLVLLGFGSKSLNLLVNPHIEKDFVKTPELVESTESIVKPPSPVQIEDKIISSIKSIPSVPVIKKGSGNQKIFCRRSGPTTLFLNPEKSCRSYY